MGHTWYILCDKSLSLVPNRERRGGVRPELYENPSRRVAFDWAIRRKPLAGRTLWMLEPTLVLTGEWCEPKEEAAKKFFRLGDRSQVWRRSAPRCEFKAVLAAQAQGCVGVP